MDRYQTGAVSRSLLRNGLRVGLLRFNIVKRLGRYLADICLFTDRNMFFGMSSMRGPKITRYEILTPVPVYFKEISFSYMTSRNPSVPDILISVMY